MYGSPFANNLHQKAPSQFKENARNAIYSQLPSTINNNITNSINDVLLSTPASQLQQYQKQIKPSSSASVRSAPSQYIKNTYKSPSHRSTSSSSSIFSSITNSGKRSVRSAPSIYSCSTATIPEDSEPVTTTVEQLINDIALHEQHFYQEYQAKQNSNTNPNLNPYITSASSDPEESYKISLGSNLTYVNNDENSFLIDWNLNVTRCKLILISLPMISSSLDQPYSQHFQPLLIGDLAQSCHPLMIQPHITDKELIFTLVQSDIYQEHDLDLAFKKSVAEISVKQSRLLQINSVRSKNNPQMINTNINENHDFLKFKFKEIAVRNYLINLAAAATTAHEYKLKMDEIKKSLKVKNLQSNGVKRSTKLSKEEKKQLWEQVRSDVFKRAGLEE
ncbi:STD1 [Candida oxycetoniae]|uniref:STD1 n=1 Tax=Candida oxycetoniae TaxID=497107 RepID=A0AAI9SUQ2_9ASCO|nr:STD1 [Candida oxycetoniae]KAI3402864.2 STD1 [Candida oxycetoniae]